MKKLLVAVIVVALVAFAAPVFAASRDPFVDVPLNHWAYGAIAQLQAADLVGGYLRPDGRYDYRGGQNMTRYEIAAMIARVDTRKADKAQLEELKKLVYEFQEELEAMGAKDVVQNVGGKMGERLNGWKISGWLRVDADVWAKGDPLMPGLNGGANVNNGSYGNSSLPRSRIIFDKWFGEDEEYHLHARLSENGGVGANAVRFQYFWVEMPGWGGSKVTVGRFNRDFTGAYNWNLGSSLTDRGFYSIVSDFDRDGFAIDKTFTMSSIKAYMAKTPVLGKPLTGSVLKADRSGFDTVPKAQAVSAWELAAIGSLQFTEKMGFDLGTQAWFLADDRGDGVDQYTNAWTLYAGWRFNLNDNAAVKAIYYLQNASLSEGDNPDSASAWKLVVDIKQDLLRFTSLWLEYGMVDGDGDGNHNGFVHSNGVVKQYFIDSANWAGVGTAGSVFPEDVSIWRLAGKQKWNDKWQTWLAVSSITGDDFYSTMQFALGVEYTVSPSVGVGLGFVNTTIDDYSTVVDADNRYLFFRTQIVF